MKRTVRKAHDIIYLKKDKQTKSQSTSCFLKPMNCKFYKLQLQKWMRCWWFYIHFPNLLRHRAFLLLVSWMTSTISPCVTGRSFAPGFFMMELGSTNMVCSTLSGPSYWETVTVVEFKKKKEKGDSHCMSKKQTNIWIDCNADGTLQSF